MTIPIPLGLVHSDLCGPLPTSLGKNKYFAVFVDDYSRYCWVYLLKQKDAAAIATIFTKWISFAQKESGSQVKALRTDGGGEYQKELSSILSSRGIQHQTTTSYTPQSNGVAERMKRSLNEAVRAMMFQANMPQTWWGEAILHAVYLRNRLPHSGLNNVTPFQLWFNRSPDYSYLKPFGCIVYIHTPKERQLRGSKYLPRATKGCFIRHLSTNICRIWDFIQQ